MRFVVALFALLLSWAAFADGVAVPIAAPQIGQSAAMSFPPQSGGGGGAIVNTACSASPGALNLGYSQPTNTLYTSVNGGVSFPENTKVWIIDMVDGGDTGSAEPSWKLGSTSGPAFTNAVGTLATSNVEIFYVDTGASSYADTLVFTGTANQYNKMGVVCGYMTNVATGAPSSSATMTGGNYASQGSPIKTATTVPTTPSPGGIAIIGVALSSATTGTPPYTITWTGATQLDTKSLATFLFQIWSAQATASATVQAANSVLSFTSGIVNAAWPHQ